MMLALNDSAAGFREWFAFVTALKLSVTTKPTLSKLKQKVSRRCI